MMMSRRSFEEAGNSFYLYNTAACYSLPYHNMYELTVYKYAYICA